MSPPQRLREGVAHLIGLILEDRMDKGFGYGRNMLRPYEMKITAGRILLIPATFTHTGQAPQSNALGEGERQKAEKISPPLTPRLH